MNINQSNYLEQVNANNLLNLSSTIESGHNTLSKITRNFSDWSKINSNDTFKSVWENHLKLIHKNLPKKEEAPKSNFQKIKDASGGRIIVAKPAAKEEKKKYFFKTKFGGDKTFKLSSIVQGGGIEQTNRALYAARYDEASALRIAEILDSNEEGDIEYKFVDGKGKVLVQSKKPAAKPAAKEEKKRVLKKGNLVIDSANDVFVVISELPFNNRFNDFEVTIEEYPEGKGKSFIELERNLKAVTEKMMDELIKEKSNGRLEWKKSATSKEDCEDEKTLLKNKKQSNSNKATTGNKASNKSSQAGKAKKTLLKSKKQSKSNKPLLREKNYVKLSSGMYGQITSVTDEEYWVDAVDKHGDTHSVPANDSTAKKVLKSEYNNYLKRIDYENDKKVATKPAEFRHMAAFIRLAQYSTKDKIHRAVLSLQRDILDRKIRAASEWSKEIETIQNILIETFNKGSSPYDVKAEKGFLLKLAKAMGDFSIFKSIQMLKRYVGATEKVLTETSFKSLKNAFLKAEDYVKSSDPYADKFKEVLNALKAADSVKQFNFNPVMLSGIEGLTIMRYGKPNAKKRQPSKSKTVIRRKK